MSNTVFPTLVSSNWAMTRTPQFHTLVQTSVSGVRTRAAMQSAPWWKWTLKNGVLQSHSTIADLQAIQNLFVAMYGMYDSFFWKDPESTSLTPGYDTYWPVAFLSDSADFDRFAYELWKSGTLSFQQVLTPLRLPARGSPPGSATITAASLTVWSAFPAGGSVIGFAEIDYSTNGGAGWTGVFSGISAGNYTLRSDSVSLSLTPAQLISQLQVLCYVNGSLFATGVSELRIYDCYLDLTFSDSSTARLRPTRTSSTVGTDLSTVTNAALAIDADASTPTTYASISRLHTSGFAIGAALTLSGFSA